MMDDDDCITISDDEDVHFIEHVVNLEPIVIDLTKCDESIRHEDERRFDDPFRSSQHPPASPPKPKEPDIPLDPKTTPDARTSPETETPSDPETPPAAKSTFNYSPESPKFFFNQKPKSPTPVTAETEAKGPLKETENVPCPPVEVTHPNGVQEHQETIQAAPQITDEEFLIKQKELGNQKYKDNKFNDALRIYKRAIPLAKTLENKEMSAILHFNLAMTYDKVKSYDQAADECVNAIKINPNYQKAHLKRAEIYDRQCKYEESTICYEHLCELDSNNSQYAALLNISREKAKRQNHKVDYFHILGLPINFNKDDLRKAYRQQALNHHPDRHSGADIVTRRIEEKRFKEVSEAYTYFQTRYGFLR